MKKIAFIYTGMNIGGAQRVVIDLAKSIKNKDYEPIIISDNGILLDEIRSSEIKHYLVPFKQNRFNIIINNFILLYKIIRNEKIDIVHSHHRYTTMLCWILNKFMNFKLIHTEHNVFPNKNKLNFKGKNIIAVSNVVKNNLLKNGVKSKFISLIYNGIHIKEYLDENDLYKTREELQITDNYINIGILARLNPEKGHLFFLDFFKEELKKRKNIKVFFIGDGPEKETINNYILKNNIQHNVALLGNRMDVINIIELLDIFVLPSFYEGLPISVLEVMSRGKIMIVSDVGGNREIIENGISGYIIKKNDPEKFREVCIYCIENKNNLKFIQENAKKSIKNNFSIEKMVRSHICYYEGVLSKNE